MNTLLERRAPGPGLGQLAEPENKMGRARSSSLTLTLVARKSTAYAPWPCPLTAGAATSAVVAAPVGDCAGGVLPPQAQPPIRRAAAEATV